MANIKTLEKAKELKAAFIQSAKNFKIDMSPRYGRYTVSIEKGYSTYFLNVKIKFTAPISLSAYDFMFLGDFVKTNGLSIELNLNDKKLVIW